jgi:hypothetical protein
MTNNFDTNRKKMMLRTLDQILCAITLATKTPNKKKFTTYDQLFRKFKQKTIYNFIYSRDPLDKDIAKKITEVEQHIKIFKLQHKLK